MNRPSCSKRLAGSPFGAMVLLAGCGFVGWAWNEGHLTWWWLLIAAFTSLKTLESIRHVRRYKAWHADWLAMGGQDAPVRPKKRRGLLIAAVLVVGLPFAASQLRDDAAILNGTAVAGALMWVWGMACLYLACCLVWKLFAQARRGVARVAAQREAKADVAPVELLVDRPTSSPSRDEILRSLPEYAAQLIAADRTAIP